MPYTQKTKQQRKPRYRRAQANNCRLQDRDTNIIRHVYKHRFLTSEHINALLRGSDQGILRRLHLLYHNGYLDRPPEQIRPYQKGSDPMVYGLGNKGADLLADLDIPRGKVDWTSKNREVKKVFLEHTLMVAHFMVCLQVACDKQGDIRLIEPEEVLKESPAGRGDYINPFSWRVQTKKHHQGSIRDLQFNLIPDKVFGLHFVKDPPGKNKAYFFLEADRGTMPIQRSNFFRTSFFKKMIGYWASWREDLFKKTFGFKNARVLTITTSEDRIKSMIQSGKEVDERGAGSKMFLFAPATAFGLAHSQNTFGRVWQNGRDDNLVSLLD